MPRQASALTARQVRNNPAGKYADGNGLYLIVDDSGARRWIARVQVKGLVTPGGVPKRREIGLGSTDLVTLSEAREKALFLKRSARMGIDPLQADESRIPSFQDLFESWFPTYSATLSNAVHVRQWRSTMRDYVFPHIGGLRVDLVFDPTV